MGVIPTSPAVVFIEKDNSSYPPTIDSSIVGIVGFASKGPTDKATLITSPEALVNTFGYPNESLRGQGLEGALEILEATNQVRFVRAIPSDATHASGVVQFGVCPSIKFEASSFGLSAANLRDISSLYLYVSVSDSNGALVGSKNYTILSSADNYTNGLSELEAIAKIVGYGTNDDDLIGMYYDADTKSSPYLVSKYAGKNAAMQVQAFSAVSTVGSTLTNGNLFNPGSFKIVQPSGDVTGSPISSGVARGGSIETSCLAYVGKSLYPGTAYNLGTNLNNGQTSGVSISVKSFSFPYTLLEVNSEGVNVESYRTSLQDDKYFIEDVINVGVENRTSDYIMGEIYVSGSNTFTPTKLNSTVVPSLTGLGLASTDKVTVVNSDGVKFTNSSPKFFKLVEGTYPLTGGYNGNMSSNSSIIGTPAAKTGIYALDDDTLNISMAIVPGINDQDVDNALVTLAESTQDFIAAVSPPHGLDTVEEAIDWMNGRSSYRTAALNSSWVTVMWPWVQVFSVYDSKDKWMDPAIYAIRQMAFTDNTAETWFAPAGFRRGRLTKPTATEVRLNQGDRDALYSANINPIVNFIPEGITIFGQKTAQRAATSLDRINVRRLMIYLRKILLITGREDLFEPNDPFTWEVIKDKCEGLLSDIQARRGITDYRVICDDTVNTPVRVDRNELWCKILIKPTKTAEWIVFEVNLTNQSAKFNG